MGRSTHRCTTEHGIRRGPCGSDNSAATGVYLTTDSTGQGSASVHIPLPAASLAGTTIGDGAGTECVAVVLDNSFSTSTGDRFVTAGFPLHGTDRSGCWPGDRPHPARGRTAGHRDATG